VLPFCIARCEQQIVKDIKIRVGINWKPGKVREVKMVRESL